MVRTEEGFTQFADVWMDSVSDQWWLRLASICCFQPAKSESPFLGGEGTPLGCVTMSPEFSASLLFSRIDLVILLASDR